MSKLHLALASGTVFEKDGTLKKGIITFLKECIQNEYDFFIMTHDYKRLKIYSELLEKKLNKKVIVTTRKEVRRAFSDEKKRPLLKTTIVVGTSEADLHLAANFKLLFIYPLWNDNTDESAKKYGFHIETPEKLISALAILNNQLHFYYTLNIDETTTLYALTSANNNSATDDESEMINRFRQVLKEGDKEYYEALFFHLISSVMKNDDLRKIDIWGIMPSSGTELNQDMWEIKERCRYLTGRRMKEPVFLRHTVVQKSHRTDYNTRINVGAKKHLDSLMINPHYKGKLKGKIVCILDDYVTNGTSFEAIRNLLMKAEVEKIYFFAFGRFKRGEFGIYQKENYKIEGNIYSSDYAHELIEKDKNFGVNGKYAYEAKTEVENIKSILSNEFNCD